MSNDKISLNTARIKAGLTQTELSRRIGITQQAVSAYEKGFITPSLDVLIALAKELSVKFYNLEEYKKMKCSTIPILVSNTSEEAFKTSFNALSEEVHETAKNNGWHDEEISDERCLLLMHSELSEACEALRHHNEPDDKIPEFTGIEAELADTVIRIMDYSALRKLRLTDAIIAKMKYNKTRSYKHGGKKF